MTEIVWLVYLADLLDNFNDFLSLMVGASIAFTLFWPFAVPIFLCEIEGLCYEEGEEIRKKKKQFTLKGFKILGSATLIFTLLSIVTPSSKLVYIYAGVEAAKELKLDKELPKVTQKAFKLLNKKLDEALSEKDKK